MNGTLSASTTLEQLDVFYGETTDSLARVYARAAVDRDSAGLSLSGYVRGPFCDESRTLPTTIPLRNLGSGAELLCESIVPDPCFWSPDVPSLYEVHVELRRDGQTIESTTRQLGIRTLGARGRSLFFSGRRWVPRGVALGDPTIDDLLCCRDAAAIAVTGAIDDLLCEEASRLGVFICTRLSGTTTNVIEHARRLARHAAIGMLVVDNPLDDMNLRLAAPNIVFGQAFAADQPVEPRSWAGFVLGQVQEPAAFAAQFANCKLPVVALRPVEQNLDIAKSRAVCDTLQRDLAAVGDYAGYFV